MKGNKRVVTVLKLPYKTLQGRCRAIKALVFSLGLYELATTLPVFKGLFKNWPYPFIPLFIPKILSSCRAAFESGNCSLVYCQPCVSLTFHL